MKRIAILMLATLLCSCGKTATAPELAAQTFGLPSPVALSRNAPEISRSVSSSLGALNRTLVSPGSDYVPWANYSANAEVSGTEAIIHGNTTALNFVYYPVPSPTVDNTSRFMQLELDFDWVGSAPAAPEGLYIGIPDQIKDRWIWFDAADANGKWVYLGDMNLPGPDPAVVPFGSFFAVVNYSARDVTLHQFAIRYNTATNVDGDEYIYYTSHATGDIPMALSVSRVPVAGGPEELIQETDNFSVVYGLPFVVDYHGVWQLTYTRVLVPGGNSEVWMSGLDGTFPIAIATATGEDVFPGGWEYNADRGLFLRSDTVTQDLYAFHDTFESGRLSMAGGTFGKSVWDLTIDTAIIGYAAMTSKQVDALNDYYNIVRVNGNSPFPINAAPGLLYTPLATEDARDPDMVELAKLSSEPRYYTYFASRNRDDATYNIYRAVGLSGEVEPVIIDPTQDLRYPTPSHDGRYLAFKRVPPGASEYAIGELVVVDLMHPNTSEVVLATNNAGQMSWYDPTP